MKIDRFCAAYPTEGVLTPQTSLLAFYPREDFSIEALDVPPATVRALLKIARMAWRSRYSGFRRPPPPPTFTALYAGDRARPIWVQKCSAS